VNPLTCMAVCMMSLLVKKLSNMGILDVDQEFMVANVGSVLLLVLYLFRILV